MKVVNEIVSDFQLIGNSVKSLKIKNDFIALPTNDTKRIIDADYSIVEITENDNSNSLIGIIRLSVKVSIKDSYKHSMNIEIDVEGAFEGRNFQKEPFETTLSLNGCATLYSIARSIIMSVTSQSLAFGSVILPLVNVYALNKAKQNENSNSIKKKPTKK